MKNSILHFFLAVILGLQISLAQGIDLNISPDFIIASGVGPDIGDASKAAIGFDGVNYLVVSCRSSTMSDNVFGVLVSTEGIILTSFSIADLNPNGDCQGLRPSVAFDGSNYLIVFSQRNSTGAASTFGTRVSPSGEVLDGPSGFSILSGVSDSGVVAYDGTNYLVVSGRFSNDTLHDIYGARVNTAGDVLDDFLIFTAPGGQVMPSIAFDGTNYLVVWSDTRDGSAVGPDADIYGTRVTPEGLVLDPEGIPVSTALGIQEYPHLIFDGNNYFAVWEDTRNGPDVFPPVLDIYGTRIAPGGDLLDGPPDTGGIAINTHSRPKQNPVVSLFGTEYFVTWAMSFFPDPPEGIFAARVSTDGILIDGPPDSEGILISEPITSSSKLAWPSSYYNGSNLLLGWINNDSLVGATNDVVGVMISHTSDMLDVEIDINIKASKKSENVISFKKNKNLKVAIVGDATFDALQVDPVSVRFGPSEASPIRFKGRDYNHDGFSDLILTFKLDRTGIACGDTEATLTGETFPDPVINIRGRDSFTVEPCP